jgi:hypothetical protein
MPETKRKIPLPNVGMVDGVDVPIKESTERWSEITLEDGAILRIKPNVMSVTRVEGHYDQEGNPMYALMSNQMMTVTNTPVHLRRPAAPAAGTKAN